MIPLTHCFILFQNSTLNKSPGENYYTSVYEGPNEISQDVAYREHTVVSLVKVSDPKGETVTRGSLYKFSMLNSPDISHLGKNIISPNW